MSFVHQDLGLFEAGTVLENLRVRRYETGFGWRISWRKERQRVRESLARFGLALDPDTRIAELSDVQRAMIAIIRALDQIGGTRGGLLVLDEPTSYLPRDTVEQLFSAICRVADLGYGVLFVTHRLEEVRAVTDRVTVLRDGAVVGTAPTDTLTPQALVSSILGFSLEQLYPAPHQSQRETLLEARGVAAPGLENLSFAIRRGEIVGFTGLLGMGQERVPYLLFGAEEAHDGIVRVEQEACDLQSMTPRRAIELGLALLPANRLRDGGVPTGTAQENTTLPTLGSYFSRGLLHHRSEEHQVRRLMDLFGVVPPKPGAEFATFSGGNQQKMLIAKWMATRPKVLLMHEPTIGVDVGAKKQIFRNIRDAAERGTAILISSVEYEDLVHLCDRVIVFRHGRAVSELTGVELTLERLLERCFLDELSTLPEQGGEGQNS